MHHKLSIFFQATENGKSRIISSRRNGDDFEEVVADLVMPESLVSPVLKNLQMECLESNVLLFALDSRPLIMSLVTSTLVNQLGTTWAFVTLMQV